MAQKTGLFVLIQGVGQSKADHGCDQDGDDDVDHVGDAHVAGGVDEAGQTKQTQTADGVAAGAHQAGDRRWRLRCRSK